MIMVLGVLHGVWADDEEIWVSKELGVLLESKGYVVTDNRAAYVSAFVMLENPVREENMCGVSCNEEKKINEKMTMGGCAQGVTRRGVESVDYTVYRMKEMEKKENSGKRDVLIACFSECSKENRCKAFGLLELGTIARCELRDRAINVLNETYHDPRSTEFDMKCIDKGNRAKLCEELAKTDPFNYRMARENREFIEKHWGIVNRWVGSEREEMERERRKRSVAATVVGGVLGFLATGYGFYDTARLKSHVEKLRVDYNDFKRRQVEFNEEQIEFNDNILKIIRGVEESVEKQLGEVKCRVDSYAYHILNERRLREWRDSLYQLYKDMVDGRWVGPISTAVFTKENMRTIIQSTDLLRETIYEENLGLAYKLGTMHVADKSIEDGKFTVHVVMRLPIILKGGMKTVFAVHQTGVRGKNGCLSFKLPESVYRDRGSYYSLDKMECEERDRLRICSSSVNATREKMPCVQDVENCEAVAENCETKAVQSYGGLLVRTAERVEAATLSEPDVFDAEKVSENGVVFFNYTEYGDVLVGKYKVRGIKSATLSKVIKTERLKEWGKMVSDMDWRLSRQNLSELSDIVRRQRELMEGWNKIGVKAASWSWWGTPLVVSIAIMITSYYAYKRGCFKSTGNVMVRARYKVRVKRAEREGQEKVIYEKVQGIETNKEGGEESETRTAMTVSSKEWNSTEESVGESDEEPQRTANKLERIELSGDREGEVKYDDRGTQVEMTEETAKGGEVEYGDRGVQVEIIGEQDEGDEIAEKSEKEAQKKEEKTVKMASNPAKVKKRKEKRKTLDEGAPKWPEEELRKRKSDIYTVQAVGLDPITAVSDSVEETSA